MTLLTIQSQSSKCQTQ